MSPRSDINREHFRSIDGHDDLEVPDDLDEVNEDQMHDEHDNMFDYELDEEIGQHQDEVFAQANLEIRPEQSSSGIKRKTTLRGKKRE